jgi:hypothetical protein
VALLDKVIRFTVIRQGHILDDAGQLMPREAFDELTDRLAEYLMDTDKVEDQSLGANIATGEVELSVDVQATGVAQAIEIGDAAIRSALHAAMVSTPTWEAGDAAIVEVEDWPAVLSGGRISVEPADLVDA